MKMTNYEKIINMCLDEMTVFFNGQTILCVSEYCEECPIFKGNNCCSPQDIKE